MGWFQQKTPLERQYKLLSDKNEEVEDLDSKNAPDEELKALKETIDRLEIDISKTEETENKRYYGRGYDRFED